MTRSLDERLRRLEQRKRATEHAGSPLDRAKFDLAMDLIFVALDGRCLRHASPDFEAEMAAQGRAIPAPFRPVAPWEPMPPAHWTDAERAYFDELAQAATRI